MPATWVVPSYSTTYCPSPSAPTTTVVGSQTWSYSEATTITVTAPTSYATYTSVFTQPEQPTSYVVDSTTYPIRYVSLLRHEMF